MKKRKYILNIIFLTFCLLFVNTVVFAENKTIIKSASEYDYPPFSIVNKEGKADGFSVELLRATLQAVNLDVEFKVGPWAEIKEELKVGTIQVLPLVARTPEREEIYDFTFSYLTLHGAIFVRKGDTRIKTVGDLSDKEIIVMKSDSGEEYVRRERVSPHIITVESYEEAMTLLASGKHDAVIAQKLAGLQLLNKMKISKIVPVDHELEKYKIDFTFAVQEGDKELLSVINEGLAITISDGTFDKFYKKWFSPILLEEMSFTDQLKNSLKIIIPFFFILSLFFIYYLRREVKRKTAGLLNEIEERKRTEEVTSRFGRILERSSNEIYVFDAKTFHFIQVNHEAKENLGYSMEELVKMTPADIKPQFTEEKFLNLVDPLLTGDTDLITFETIHERKDGSLYPVDVRLNYFGLETPPLFVAIIQDITQRKEAEREIKETRNKFLKLFMEVSIPLCYVNKDGVLVHINNRFTELFGYTLNDVPTLKEWWEQAYPDTNYREWVLNTWNAEVQKAAENNIDIKPLEYDVTCKNGEIKNILIGGVAIGEDLLATFVDLTEIKAYEKKIEISRKDLKQKNIELDQLNKTLEERVKVESEKRVRHESLLMQKSKMAAMGEMISAIAHQWRQPLNVLGLTIQEVKDSYEYNELSEEYINDIVIKSMGQINFMSKTIDDFRNFFRPSKEKVNFDIEKEINSTIALISAQLAGRDITIKTEFQQGKDLSLIGYPNEFKQAVLNILHNAIDAVTLAYKKGLLEKNKGFITIRTSQEESSTFIEIEDNGGEIPKKDLSRIFEPYFTTKEEEKGTGIGLYMTQMILENMGGKISVENLPDGVCFRIKF